MKVKGTILVLAVVVLLVSFSAGEKIGSNAAPLSSIHPHAKVGRAITVHADSNTKVGQVLCARHVSILTALIYHRLLAEATHHCPRDL